MLFIITAIISLLFAQVKTLATYKSSSLSYDSSNCSSPSSCSFDGETSQVCKDELANIEAQPDPPAAQYLRSLQAVIEAQLGLWMNPTTRTETAIDFCAAYRIQIRIFDAMGFGIEYPSLTIRDNPTRATHMRAEALNKGAIAKGMAINGHVYYSFQIFTSNGEYAMIELRALRRKMPLGNLINFKRKDLRNCN